MKLIKTSIVTAILAFGAQNQSLADSFASAKLDINNFVWSYSTTASGNYTPLSNAQFAPDSLGGYNKGQLVLNYPSTTGYNSTIMADIPETDGAVSDSACIGPSGCGDAPALTAPPVPGSYSYGSYKLTGAIIDIGSFAAGANASVIAEVSLKENRPIVDSSLNLGTNTSFTFVNGDTDVYTRFGLDYSYKYVNELVVPRGNKDATQTNLTWTITIKDVTTSSSTAWNLFNQTRGTNALSSNYSDSSSGTVTGSTCWDGSVSEGVSTCDGTKGYKLFANHQYNIVIAHTAFANASRKYIPEPASLALFGIGMIGFAMRAKSRRIVNAGV